MNSQRKESLWLFTMIGFYIITGFLGSYDVSMAFFWPLFAIPMSLFLIKTGKKEVTALIGVLLSVIISFISTGTFHPIVVAVFLLFIMTPSFIFGILYNKQVIIPQIIITTTIVYFASLIIFLTFSKLLNIDYLDSYFAILDATQDIWNEYLSDVEVQKLLPQGENVLEMYMQVMASAIRSAKRTYPATLFTMSLVTTTIHLLLIQLIATIRSWDRPKMKEIFNIGLSPAAAWVLIILWIVIAQMGRVDTIWTFAAESMLSVLFILFQIIGLITMIVLIMKMGATKIIRVMLSIIGILWLILNPTLLVIVGCMDSIFNFRKVKTFI